MAQVQQFMKSVTPLDAGTFPIGHGAPAAPEPVAGFSNAVKFQDTIYPRGVATADPSTLRDAGMDADRRNPFRAAFAQIRGLADAAATKVFSIPILSRGRSIDAAGFDFGQTRDDLFSGMQTAATEWLKSKKRSSFGDHLAGSLKVGSVKLPVLWGGRVEELLSPIGIAHYYRQLYFNKEEGVGPIEQAFTIAPLENFEIAYETTRKQIHEEIMEQGLEVVSESATEEKNLDEISDKTSSMVQQDVSAAMSANVSGGIGVWSMGASASASYGVSSQNGREDTSRRLKEVTKRASERVTKSFSLKTRDTTEITTSSTTRRLIRNDSTEPVSYGLRRVLRKVAVKVQDLGPRLIWQLYLHNPGNGLAVSKFVHFLEGQNISVPQVPDGVPVKPVGGSDTGTVQAHIIQDATTKVYYVDLVVNTGPDRQIKALRIDTLTDLESGGKDDHAHRR